MAGQKWLRTIPTSIDNGLIHYLNLFDFEDSRIALICASLPRLSITHVGIAAKSGNVIEIFFDPGCDG